MTNPELIEKYKSLYVGNPEYILESYIEDWDKYFLSLAFKISERSKDSQTKHGTVIVKNRRILSTGYNSFPSNLPDEILPNVRKDGAKYPFVQHSELNAIIAAARNGISIDGATAYVTGPCCAECSKALISCGILNWVIGNRVHQWTDKEKLLMDFWIDVANVKVKHINEL